MLVKYLMNRHHPGIPRIKGFPMKSQFVIQPESISWDMSVIRKSMIKYRNLAQKKSK